MVRIEVTSDYAVFRRSEFDDVISYDVMTPVVATNILGNIYWKPGIDWHVDRIYVCNPIKFALIRPYQSTATSIKALKDVRYVIEAHFNINRYVARDENQGKVSETFKRYLKHKDYYTEPYLGVRACPVHISNCEQIPDCPPELQGTINLGKMPLAGKYNGRGSACGKYFDAVMVNGTITIPGAVDVDRKPQPAMIHERKFETPYTAIRRDTGMEQEELDVQSSTNIPYTLGEAFAVYESALKHSSTYSHVDIRDKYMQNASMSPVNTFPMLSRMYISSLRSFTPAQRDFYERTLAELLSKLGEEYPTRMTLNQQGEFDLGYYHRLALLQNAKM